MKEVDADDGGSGHPDSNTKNTTAYKITVSIIFGLLGFAVNFHTINFSFPPYTATVLIGLLFPMLITLKWGFRYGLLSALAGGCQSVWWIWGPSNGYAIFFVVPPFTLWIAWHGLFADMRKRRGDHEWWLNKYVVEIPFRILSTINLYTLARWAITLNPPPWGWASGAINTIPMHFTNFVVIKQLVVGYIILLLADVLLNLGFVRRFFGLEERANQTDTGYIISASLLLGALFWIIDSIVGSMIFHAGSSFLDLLALNIPPYELYARTFFILACLVGGLLASTLLRRQRESEETLRRREEQMSAVLDNATVHIWAFDGRRFYRSREWYRYTGQDPALPRTIERWTDVVHPEDLDKAVETWHKAWNSEGVYEDNFRLRSAEGEYGIFQSHAVPVYDENGKFKHYQGYNIDVTECKRVEGALRESEKRFKDISFSMADWIWEVDEEGVYTYCSEKVQEVLGYYANEVIGRTPFDLMPPEEAEKIGGVFKEILEEKRPIKDLENWNLSKDGRRVCLLTSGLPFFDDQGNLKGYRGLTREITDRKLSEERMRICAKRHDEAAKFGKLAISDISIDELMDEAVVLISRVLDTKYSKVLEHLPCEKKLFLRAGVGWKEGWVGRLTMPDGVQSQGGYSLLCDSPVISEDIFHEKRFSPPPLLTEHDVVSGMTVVIPGKERPYGVLGVHTDRKRMFSSDDANFIQTVANVLADAIELKREKERLHESELQYRTLLEVTDTGFVILDMEGRILDLNSEYVRMTGHKERDQVIGKDVSEWIAEYDRQRNRDAMQGLLTGELIRDLEIDYVQRDGSVVPIEVNAAVAETKDGKRIMGLCRDTSEIKRAKSDLLESEKRFRDVAESALEWVWECDANGRYTYTSPVVEKILGYTPEEVLKKHFYDLFHPEGREELKKVAFESFAKKEPFHDFISLNAHKDGKSVWLLTSGVPVLDGKGDLLGYRGMDSDITERKEAEEVLHLNESRLKALLELGQMTESSLEQITEFTLEKGVELTKSKIGYFGFMNEDETSFSMCAWSKTAMGECAITDKSMLYPVKGGGILMEPIRQRKPVIKNDFSAPDPRKKGFPEGHIQLSRYMGIPVFDGDRIVIVAAVGNKEAEYDESDVRQLTLLMSGLWRLIQRKQAKEELMQTVEDLKRSNAELEQFAYVASHDLQEPLRMISSYVQLLERRYTGKLDSDADEFIAFAVDGANRMQILINDLLTFSRVGTRGKPFEPTDCALVLEQVLTNLKVTIEESGAVITHDALPTVMADDSQLVQLFQNLIENAIKFHSEEPPRSHISAEQKGDEWVFSIHDNGIGIKPEFFERIFVIFQRLHGIGEYSGTGIGLAVCKKIVERHGGRIWVESEPGEGTTFYFTIAPKK